MKQRLVGAIVLGCLAIIFIPILLDGEGIKSEQMTRNIPPAPKLSEIAVIAPTRPVILSDTDELDVAEDIRQATNLGIDISEELDTAIITAIEEAKPQLTQQGLPETWSVRLGSFRDKANAQSLVIRLVDSNYKAYSRLIDSSQGILTAVYVGPVLTRADASTLQIELEEKFEMTGIVVEFIIKEMTQ